MNAAGYVNPFTGAGAITAERIDQGQDFALTPGAPIRAIGRAKVLGIEPNWYAGQPFVYYQLLEGPQAGRVVYVAEQINPTVKPGDVVAAGSVIGTYASSGTGIETGWATPSGQTLAGATSGYSEGQQTAAGASFSSFLAGLGVKTAGTSSGGGTGAKVKEVIPGECSVPIIGGLICKVGGLAQEAGEHAGGAAKKAEEQVGEEAVKGAIGLVKPIATKLALYADLILGAVAMVIYGAGELLKPVGGPDIKSALRKGAIAGAAA